MGGGGGGRVKRLFVAPEACIELVLLSLSIEHPVKQCHFQPSRDHLCGVKESVSLPSPAYYKAEQGSFLGFLHRVFGKRGRGTQCPFLGIRDSVPLLSVLLQYATCRENINLGELFHPEE